MHDPERTASWNVSPSGPSDPEATRSAEPLGSLEEASGLTRDPPSEASAHPLQGFDIPGYEILEEVGRGGMGVVFRARQRALNREVALKMILRSETTRSSIARFWAEAEVMAAVRHPNVVQIFELGECDGRPFMAMEYITGGSLADRLKRKNQDANQDTARTPASAAIAPVRAAVLIEKIARGVAAAHDLGIVHRDLKPGNVLLAGDEPKVTDFGLAKRATNDLTATQAMMGTPAYMAPEQAAGRAKFVGPAADVWAIGVMLYECIAGQRPFEGDSTAILLTQIQTAEPRSLRATVHSLPWDLETIIAKCLAKEPEHRFPTAADLAGDLGRFVRGEPIAARPVGGIERLVRWVRRKPTAAAAYVFSSTAVLLALIVAVVFGFWREAEQARDRLADEKLQTESARDEAVRLRSVADNALLGELAAKREVERQRELLARTNYGRTIQVAYQNWKENSLVGARRLLAGTRPDLRGWEYDYVHRLCHMNLFSLDHQGVVHAARYSPDGRKIVTASEDATACLWDAFTGEILVKFLGHAEGVRAAVFSPDGSRVATGGTDHTVRIWNTSTGHAEAVLRGHTEPVDKVVFSRDGAKMLSTSQDKTVRVWDARAGKPLSELKGNTNGIREVMFDAKGLRVQSQGYDNTVRVWEGSSGKLLATFAPDRAVLAAAFDSDGPVALTAAFVGQPLQLHDVRTGKVLLEGFGGDDIVAARFTPNCEKIIATSQDGTVHVCDTKTTKTLLRLKKQTSEDLDPVFSSDGRRMLDRGLALAKTSKLWSLETGELLAEWKGDSGLDAVADADVSPDGTRIVSANRANQALVWRVQGAGGRSGVSIDFKDGEGMTRMAIAPDGRTVAACGGKTLFIWNAFTGERIAQRDGHTDSVLDTAFSPDGSKIATGGLDKTARIWDARTGEHLWTLEGHTAGIVRVAFSPDSRMLATASDDKTARLWDASSGNLLKVLSGHSAPVRSAAFSPDGSQVATISEDATAIFWNVQTGEQTRKIKVQEFSTDIAFSPDGTKIVTAGGKGAVWDLDGRLLLELVGHTNQMRTVEFSPDGRRILTSAHEGTARLWDAESGAELLSLPGGMYATFSRDGTKILTERQAEWRGAIVYDSTPLNRKFIRRGTAPLPREK